MNIAHSRNTKLVRTDSDGIDIKNLNPGDQFFITDEADGGTNNIFNTSLVELIKVKKNDQKMEVVIKKVIKGFDPLSSMSYTGAKMTVGPSVCFTVTIKGEIRHFLVSVDGDSSQTTLAEAKL